LVLEVAKSSPAVAEPLHKTMREEGDFIKKSKFLSVRQRKNLRYVHSAWEPVDDQSLLDGDHLIDPRNMIPLLNRNNSATLDIKYSFNQYTSISSKIND
jgi:hypothetical protein